MKRLIAFRADKQDLEYLQKLDNSNTSAIRRIIDEHRREVGIK